MTDQKTEVSALTGPLKDAAKWDQDKILNPESLEFYDGISSQAPVLVVLAAGKGTRFGTDPKCIQLVNGTPLARHSIDSFRRCSCAPVICLVSYLFEQVSTALGNDNIYIHSGNPTGGTAFAAFEVFCVSDLLEKNPLLIITMGDRIVPPSIFRRLWETHVEGEKEADLTFLSARYEQNKNRGKGRVVRNEDGCVQRIVEEKDIHKEKNEQTRQMLFELEEGNCPLYAVRAKTLESYLKELTNDNAQGQFYLTDVIQALSHDGGDIRTITTTIADPEYDLLCSDVTQAMDLAFLEGILASTSGLLFPEELEAAQAAKLIAAERPGGQVASIARQLEELVSAVNVEKLNYKPDQPVSIGISGGRLRIAFMHPDMARFYGPAWQMPIGAGDEKGEEQIVILVQSENDRCIHLYPMNPKYRESINFIPSDNEIMYPAGDIFDMHAYEEFGTRMSENLLLSLGYFSDEELNRRKENGQPLPPPSLWAGNNMRRPFTLVGNAIASMRTLRTGNLGAKVHQHLGRNNFQGLRLVSTGNIPQGGFSSSSAVTIATKNALNALYDIKLPPDLLVHLACQAEYGTGVQAGSLDQATEQKGKTGQGTLISSNPKDNYKIMGTYPVPTDRFRIIFPYSVARDTEAWRWSWGAYAAVSDQGVLTSGETRKMTGKSAEIAAIITQIPLDTDFFKKIEEDIVQDGQLSLKSRSWICSILVQIPLLASQEELQEKLEENRDWYLKQLMEHNHLDQDTAGKNVDAILESLFLGWHDPIMRRISPSGKVVEEKGIPLRAMIAYLFGEVAKNFYLIHHPDQWIEYITLSQGGDRCVDIASENLPSREDMESELDWEKDKSGPELLNLWLERFDAMPVDYNRGLDNESLSLENPPEFHRLAGSNFFRGLAMIDLAEAMLKRVFGHDAVAIRVNAAGQGDYFQVHADTEKVEIGDVKRFIRIAFYKRFGLSPETDFVDLHPGGGAVGIRLNRYDTLTQLIRHLKMSSENDKS